MNWESIKTIEQFDSDILEDRKQILKPPYNEENRIFDANDFKKRELITTNPSTSTSLLMESLIHLLCSILEDDSKVANEMYKAICKQLKKIYLINDSYALDEFEELRSQYQMQIYKIICAVRGQDIPLSLPSINPKTQPVETCWSRYRREFDELSFVASGGFGKVYKARHKLDGIEYAVKQVKIYSTTIKLCHLAEVKTIASLNHPNIVQYKAAWLEPFFSNNQNKLEEIQNITSSKNISNQTNESYSESDHDIKKSDNDSSDFIEFEYSKRESMHQTVCKYKSNSSKKIPNKPQLAILYIQMSLCQINLRKWLDERNANINFEEYYKQFFRMQKSEINHLEIVNDIFSQILSGLSYIHSRNIVHHDIKPSNIFLGLENDGKLVIQLGDFGLACPLQNQHHGFAIGTPLYAAPEQLDGDCNPKSDIYSLGIVLIELLLKFVTSMERAKTIENARKGIFSSDLNRNSAKLLQSLLNHVSLRPNTEQLLEALRAINLEQNLRVLKIPNTNNKLKDATIKDLNQKLEYLNVDNTKSNNEVQKLREEVKQKDNSILELTRELENKNEEIKKLKAKLMQYTTI